MAKISVIIPAVNEAEIIAARVLQIQEHGGDAIREIIVCDGDSDDATVALAEKAGAKVLRCAERNRALQMNAGASVAKADIFYFVHADTQLPPSFASDIEEAVQAGYDSGCYRFVFDSPKPILKFNAWTTRFDRIFCRGGDQTLFVKREVFKELKGFDEAFVIMEDYDFLIRLRKKFSFAIIPKNVLVSARKYATNSWLHVQVANLIAFGMFRLKFSPQKIKHTYKKMLNYRHDGIRN